MRHYVYIGDAHAPELQRGQRGVVEGEDFIPCNRFARFEVDPRLDVVEVLVDPPRMICQRCQEVPAIVRLEVRGEALDVCGACAVCEAENAPVPVPEPYMEDLEFSGFPVDVADKQIAEIRRVKTEKGQLIQENVKLQIDLGMAEDAAVYWRMRCVLACVAGGICFLLLLILAAVTR